MAATPKMDDSRGSSLCHHNRGIGSSAASSDTDLAMSLDKDFDKSDVEDNHSQVKDQEDRDDSKEPIVYHYLDFSTEMPTPSTYRNPRLDYAPIPEPPDLNQYQSPYDWPLSRKRFIAIVSVISTGAAAFAAGSYSPAIGQLTEEWGVSTVAAFVGVAIFTCGFGIAPMVLAPFSEINGRKPVFIATGILFVICQLCCAVTRSFGGMLAARFFVGVGGSTFSTMVGGIVSDVFAAKDRNTPMALFSTAALTGTALGPLTCSWIAVNTNWRWIFYMQVIIDALIVGVVALCFRETRGSVLLSRKAACLNKYYEAREAAGYPYMMISGPISSEKGDTLSPQRIRWKVRADEERDRLVTMIRISCVRPFHLLLTEPVVFWFSCWAAFSWVILYLTLPAIPLVYQTIHGFNLAQSNSIFTAMIIGSIIAGTGSIYQEAWFDSWVKSQVSKNAANPGREATMNRLSRWLIHNPSVPERRLYFSCIQSLCLPIGLFLFGWTSASSIHWVVPAIGITVATIGIFSVYLSVFNYLADTYAQYASSALAAQSFCRNMIGGASPLFTTQMYKALGYGPASSLMGGIGLLLTVVPWILVLYGPQIRRRSKFASALV